MATSPTTCRVTGAVVDAVALVDSQRFQTGSSPHLRDVVQYDIHRTADVRVAQKQRVIRPRHGNADGWSEVVSTQRLEHLHTAKPEHTGCTVPYLTCPSTLV